MVEIHKYSVKRRTFCELVEGEEYKLATSHGLNGRVHKSFSSSMQTWATEAIRNSQVGQAWPHFRTFCELVEGEENKLTTFSTWTIMVGCNESNIIFQQHLCKLGQLRRNNGRNSQIFGQVTYFFVS